MRDQAHCGRTLRTAPYEHSPRRLYPEPNAPASEGAARWIEGATERIGLYTRTPEAGFAPPSPPSPIGALDDLGAQLIAIHAICDQLERKLDRVLAPAVPDRGDGDAPATGGPVCRPALRDLVRGANRAANRLASIASRIDL